ncbi:TRAP transporter substrate-binding protein DctP, partial [Oceanicola sp. S124]|uniref:TRAP transporter substrate-binding protein DctP n=1 Tax=Oceanicola sp. S124 TaxID=1042378 RepID=UPI000255859E
MKKLSIAAVLLAGTTLAAQADEIRYATWAQPGEAPYAGAMKFKEVVEANSDHTVTIFPGDQLGKPKEVYSQMALGSTQILASGDPGMKEIEYLALPYLMSSLENYATVLGTDFGQDWNQRLVNERMVRLIGFMPRSPRQISANKVINGIGDLSGLKLRAPERDYYVKSLAALGANPTPMAFAEVYT